MIKLYHAPFTRSVRIYWLLEELGVPYQLETVSFQSSTIPFGQTTPAGKLPAIEDGDLTMFESGAILEYIIERYGKGRLAPAPGSSLRGRYLQWVHFSEATAFPPLGTLAWHVFFKKDADAIPTAIADYRSLATASLRVVESSLAHQEYLLESGFSGADIMMGFTLAVAKMLGVLTDQFPNVTAYLKRLEARPAFQKAALTPAAG
jgi:glutathione S-transferase